MSPVSINTPRSSQTLSCAENLFIGDNIRRRTLLSWRTMRREARAVLERWGLQVDVEARAGELNVAERQLLEIAARRAPRLTLPHSR